MAEMEVGFRETKSDADFLDDGKSDSSDQRGSTTSEGGSDTVMGVILDESILAAQREADEVADEQEEKGDVDENAPLPAVPKLLTLPQEQLVNKTKDMQQRGDQLDLLLLKAESYSKFIAENQKRSKLVGIESKTSAVSTEKKRGGGSSGGKRKSAKGRNGDSPSSSLDDIVSTGSAPTSGEGTVSLFRQPSSLKGGTLKPYQLEGLQWLLSLWENGLSGILADEMGLGKTIQIIALIAHLRSCDTPGPFLIVGPLAVLPNWINEFTKWLPSCPVVLYHGSKADRADIRSRKMPQSGSKGMDFPIVVTSFEICMIDRPHLERYVWQYMILDEGHRIKNRNCKLLKELKSIQTISRLLLTGTPIQNTLEELWSLLNFCSPGIFDDLEVFQSWFGFRDIGQESGDQVEDIVQTEHKERVVSKLHDILRPFLLRRMKRDVLADHLPPKREIVVFCGMSSLQREYIAHIHNHTLRETLVNMGIEGAAQSALLNPVMQLRKAANHPFLFGEPKDERGTYLGEANPKLLTMASGKLRALEQLLSHLKKNGHKVLIFSQMTEVLSILEDFLLNKGWGYCRLDGSTHLEDRQVGIDAFNKDPTSNDKLFVYLLSTRAGGLGINLTAADTCILFDSDWNPHADSQAQDRCHRIGQKKPVVVYRLLTRGSVEIDMMEKQISKRKLERLTIHGGDFKQGGMREVGGELTLSRLRELLEDDVRNLNRMTDNKARGGSEVAMAEGIDQTELALILDRESLFTQDRNGKYSINADGILKQGRMYDVLDDTSTGSLGQVGY